MDVTNSLKQIVDDAYNDMQNLGIGINNDVNCTVFIGYVDSNEVQIGCIGDKFRLCDMFHNFFLKHPELYLILMLRMRNELTKDK